MEAYTFQLYYIYTKRGLDESKRNVNIWIKSSLHLTDCDGSSH